MKQSTLWITIISCALMNGTLAMGSPAPKLVVDEPRFDFGESANTRVIEHIFVLRNTGDLPLEILNIRSSCGCTVADISTRRIPPGETGTVTGRLNLQGRHGRQNSILTLETNDPKAQRQQLVITGTATQSIGLQPARVFFGQLSSDTPMEQAVTLSTQAAQGFEITEITWDSSYLEIEHESDKSGRKHVITVKTRNPLPQGLLQDVAVIKTTHPDAPALELPVSIQVVGALAVAPQQITMVASQTMPVTRYLVVRPGTVQEFDVLEVDVPVPDIRVQVLKMPNQAGYRIQLSNLVSADTLEDTPIVIKTNVAGMEEIKVPFQLVR